MRRSIAVPRLKLRLTSNCSFGIRPWLKGDWLEGCQVLRASSLNIRIATGAAMLLLAGAPQLSSPAAAGPASGIQVAESDAGQKPNTGGMDPALEARLDQAAAAYKQIAAADVASLVANCDTMLAAIQAGDMATARQAWVAARVAYERSEIFTIKFPSLDAAIDPWPNDEIGFHGVEAKIFTPGAPPPVAVAEALVSKVHTLQKVFTSEPIYAHGVLVGIGALAFELGESKAQGGESAISGTSLADMQHNVEGIELAWNTVFSAAMQDVNKGVAGRVESEIAQLKQLVSVGSLEQIDTPAVEKLSETLAGSVSDAAIELGWKAPDFTDSD